MKKVLSVILCLVMTLGVFTMVPFNASAAEIQQSVGAASGTTGECTWTLTDDGVLTISGNGSMESYDYYNNIAPWRSYDVTEVIIEDGVKDIGGYAFYKCSSLANVSIPDSVEGIGTHAFAGCASLVSIDIPDSVYDIGYGAFTECTSLSSIVIPDSVEGIYEGVFWACTNLSDVTLSSSLVTIGNSVFRECRSLKNITIPDTVTQIGRYAFYNCSALTNISLGDSLTRIDDCAFEFCTSLREITLPDSVTTTGEQVFHGCNNLESVILGNSLQNIQGYMFAECSSLKNIEIQKSVQNIYRNAFSFCTSLENIIIPDSVTMIDEQAFRNCSSLTGLTIPDSVTAIRQRAFLNCSSLESVTIGNSVTYIGSGAFNSCNNLSKVFIDDLSNWFKIYFDNTYSNPICLAHNLYVDNELLTELVIPDSIISIGNYAFEGCSCIETLVIPDSVTNIGNFAFDRCRGIENLTIGNSVETIGGAAFDTCSSIKNVVIPDSVTSIGNSAFFNCESLESVIIPDSVTSIGDKAFYYCTSLTIYGYTDSAAETYAKENGFDFVPLPTFNGHSLSLNGDIGVNFFTSFDEKYITEGAEVSFSWTAGDKEKSEAVVLTAADKTDNGYKATCHVAPAEITSEITATLKLGGQAVLTDAYSVKQYADEILRNEGNYDSKLISLVKAMLDYGTRAQIKFNCDVDHLANGGNYTFTEPVNPADIMSTMSDMTANLSDYGLEYTGSTVVLLTETSIRHYYKIIDSGKFEAVKDHITFNGAKAGYTVKRGEIYFELKNISAPDIDTPYTLHIGENDYDYAVTDYIKNYLTNGTNNDTKAIAAAMYYYNQMANAYFG